jgi:hypothetical protein
MLDAARAEGFETLDPAREVLDAAREPEASPL